MKIYIIKNGQQIGPFSKEEVFEKLESGIAKGTDLAWCDGRSDWVPLAQILDISPALNLRPITNEQWRNVNFSEEKITTPQPELIGTAKSDQEDTQHLARELPEETGLDLASVSPAPNQIEQDQKNQSPPIPQFSAMELIRNLGTGFSCYSIYMKPDVPEEKVRGAIGSYAPDINPEDILLLHDTTFFGSAKMGFLLTNDGIYWQNPHEIKHFINYKNIYKIMKEDAHLLSSAYLLINNERIQICADTMKNKNEIAEFVNSVLLSLKKR